MTAPAEKVAVPCDGWCDKTDRGVDGDVTYIDEKGYAYCTPCGQRRQGGDRRCRKLRPHEKARLERGLQLAGY